MKTPREILWQRHQSAEAKLDAIRREVVAGEIVAPQLTAGERIKPAFSFRGLVLKMWEELVLPCPRVWVGMAAVWVVVFALRFVSPGTTEMAAVKMTPPTPEVMAALREQTQMRRQLLDTVAQPVARSGVGGPRSEKRREGARLL